MLKITFCGSAARRYLNIEEWPNNNNENLSGGGSRAHKNYTGMYGMQTTQLQHDEGQENSSGPYGNKEVLQILQETYHA